MEYIDQFKQWIEDSHNIVFFGGAGVSTESGVPDFRGPHGLYQKQDSFPDGSKPGWADFPVEEILSRPFFNKYPDLFYDYVFKKLYFPDIKPNATHNILTEWEQKGKLLGVITQNIDGLHQAAQTQAIVELHGTLSSGHCIRCHQKFTLDEIKEYKDQAKDKIPRCPTCQAVINTDVILYGDALRPDNLTHASQWIQKADLLIVAGTSLTVYPAANLIHLYSGNRLVLINEQSTAKDDLANLILQKKLSDVWKSIQ